MYLKQLEILGFKSFADRTRLTFDPGMIAIVGPNGCGKSNVSDAIRWVLGEQRPTAIRCSKLVDVVFNGTDTRKPLGLAEVSITFSDCEALLGTEYHEVTVTRRVYRSGEGEYAINKTPCRLKDIQRLFMGTGIGTTSYSVMAQGQIDQILSSRPEDRRAVFEEAAGITKFKADRKDALRKIDQTEQNLLREADVLREMKRQIGSLQRQVGKANRYKELRDELRSLDVYVSKGKIAAYTFALETNASEQKKTEAVIAEAAEAVNQVEMATQGLHADLHAIEERLGELATAAASADGAYRRAHEVIAVNEQRITEYKMFEARDDREISQTRRQMDELDMQKESLEQKKALLEDALEIAKESLVEAEETFRESSAQIDSMRQQLAEMRNLAAAAERRIAAIRDEKARREAEEREMLMRRERLASELAQLEESTRRVQALADEVGARLEAARAEEERAEAWANEAELRRSALAEELEATRTNFGQLQRDAAAKRAQLDLLEEDDSQSGVQDAVKLCMGGERDEEVVTAADIFGVDEKYRLAIEACLRAWMSAIIVPGEEVARIVARLRGTAAGAAQLVSNTPREGAAWHDEYERLLEVCDIREGCEAAAEALIGDVLLVEEPLEVPGWRTVTLDGTLTYPRGVTDVWMAANSAATPLGRRMLLEKTRREVEELDAKIAAGRELLENSAARRDALEQEVASARMGLEKARREAAQTEGEFTGVSRDRAAAGERLERVKGELQAIGEANRDGDREREKLSAELGDTIARRDGLMDESQAGQERLELLERRHGEESRQLTEKRIAAAQMEAELQLAVQQEADVRRRKTELDQMIAGRQEGIKGYEDSIRRLQEETADLVASLDELKDKVVEIQNQAEEEKVARGELQDRLRQAEQGIGGKRQELDRAREYKGKLEVAATEASMRLANVFEHLTNEYGLSADMVEAEKDPDWKGGEAPPQEVLEARVSELAAQISALGPVNMVAIEECRELEERYEREKAQEADLISAKEQITALIKNLNEKSSSLFRATFAQADENFRKMFTKLFNGGEAKLVMLENEQDPLECGIDIIARPPGKRPQSVTLLSGGERTMTAVALLFAIFMIKPAPFCMLDELDAALDDANIGRFVDALKEFLDRSQFLIITHNQHTIAGSDLVYGVSQQEKGVSRILSMKLSEIGVKNGKEAQP